MPIADTELLFALGTNDPRHSKVLLLLKELKSVQAPDTAILEFQMVLKARGRTNEQIRLALLALNKAMADNKVSESRTIDTALLALQIELESKYGLTYFDSLIAASALILGGDLISDDKAFDRVPDLSRTSLSHSFQR